MKAALTGCCASLAFLVAAFAAAESAPKLKIGIVQFHPESHLGTNLRAMQSWIERGGRGRVRVLVFPEAALRGNGNDTEREIERAVDELRRAAVAAKLYLVFGGVTPDSSPKRSHNWAKVVDPQGRTILHYDKIFDRKDSLVPPLFHIDGVPASAILCADRWLRAVEDLPIVQGAKISFELSNNYESEWVDPLGWYWYAPRARRNGAWVVFANAGNPTDAASLPPLERKHGHSAVFAPDGSLAAATRDAGERMLITELDLDAATRAEALARAEHPVFAPFWQAGLELVSGGGAPEVAPVTPYRSPEIELTVAAAQMTSTSRIDDNLARMWAQARQAARRGARLVAFPELAVTGPRPADIRRATPAVLGRALARLRAIARAHHIAIVAGMPHLERGARFNSAFVVGVDGTLLTRYDQMTASGDLFAPGSNPRAMWFRVDGVPAVVTIGRDALWSEIAELTAAAGAQLHVNMANEAGRSRDARLRRLQIAANVASFFTLTIAVNGGPGGGTALWDHLAGLEVRKRYRKDEPPVFDPGSVDIFSVFSASCVARAGEGDAVLHATRRTNAANPMPNGRYNRAMLSWYEIGARLLGAGPEF